MTIKALASCTFLRPGHSTQTHKRTMRGSPHAATGSMTIKDDHADGKQGFAYTIYYKDATPPPRLACMQAMPRAGSLLDPDRQHAPVKHLAMQHEVCPASRGGAEHVKVGIATSDGGRHVKRAPEVIDTAPDDFKGGLLCRPHRGRGYLWRRRGGDAGKFVIIEETAGYAESLAAVLLDVYPDLARRKCHSDIAKRV